MKKEHGDRLLFTQHDYNFYTCCGFLGIAYNPVKPALKFVALVHDRFQEFELSWKHDEALVARCLGDIEHFPALSQITNEMATRLMVAGEKGLIMIMPESKPNNPNNPNNSNSPTSSSSSPPSSSSRRVTWAQPPENSDMQHYQTPPPSPPMSPTTLMNKAKFQPIYKGHRTEKNSDLVFKVHEAILGGTVGRTLRFVVEKRPRKMAGENIDPRKKKEAEKKLTLEFYYSTELLQQILVSMETIGQRRLKKDLCRNLCKYLIIDEGGGMSKGLAELKFDLDRLQMKDIVVIDGAPGNNQTKLNNRLAQSSSLLSRALVSPRFTTQPQQGHAATGARPVGKTTLLHTSTGKRPVWAGTHVKVLTTSEMNQTPKGNTTLDLLYRDTKRAITPDSVVLMRRMGLDATHQVPCATGGPMRVFNSSVNRWRNKAMLPNERLAALPPILPKTNKRREMQFYAGARNYEQKSKDTPRILDHTVASHRGQWERRKEPTMINDLMLSHDHHSTRSGGGGQLASWNSNNRKDGSAPILTPHASFVKSPRYGKSVREGMRQSTVRSGRYDRWSAKGYNTGGSSGGGGGAAAGGGVYNPFRKASEVQYMNTDSVKAAKSIVSERAVRDGIFGNAINVGFEIS